MIAAGAGGEGGGPLQPESSASAEAATRSDRIRTVYWSVQLYDVTNLRLSASSTSWSAWRL